MLKAIIQHYNFRLALQAYAPDAITYLETFLENLPAKFIKSDSSTFHRRIIFVTPEEIPAEQPQETDPKYKIWAMFHRSWVDLVADWKGGSLLAVSKNVADWLSTDFVCLLPKLKPNEILTSNHRYMILSVYAFRMKRSWLMEKGGVLIHSSAVIRNKRGFMFLGKSGAGKSTTAWLSQGVVEAIFHDDRVFILKNGTGYNLVQEPSMTTKLWDIPETDQQEGSSQKRVVSFNENLEAPLGAIFILKQDKEDYLLPVSDLTAAHALYKGFLDGSQGLISSEQGFKRAFQVISDIARKTPVFELHLRKDPGFWRLIDEQFPS